jgi:3-phosphoshikimate 1-carboxyvinyltransferase
MEQLTLKPAHQVSGTIKLPGSKSISNRTLLLAALSEGTTEIRDLLASDDTARMLEALETLGVKLENIAENAVRVTGNGGLLAVKKANLFLGNAGTAFRPLTAALALLGGEF